jgi:hypothetical protein
MMDLNGVAILMTTLVLWAIPRGGTSSLWKAHPRLESAAIPESSFLPGHFLLMFVSIAKLRGVLKRAPLARSCAWSLAPFTFSPIFAMVALIAL